MNSYSPFEIINKNSSSNLIFICEHASNFIPPAYHDLGLTKGQLLQHIAWDIGAKSLTAALAKKLSCPAINACFSRLLIDPNRGLKQKGLIPEISDHIAIKDNLNLKSEDENNRINQYYKPFHSAVSKLIHNNQNSQPILFNIHSFTPEINNVKRPWKIGLLWNEDLRIRDLLLPLLEEKGFDVGDNEPYSGKDLYFTLDHHAAPHGLPHIMIEIRQDQINTPEGVLKYCDILNPLIKNIAKTFT